MEKHLSNVFALILALAIILSCTLIGNKATDPATYSHTIEALDRNRSTVLALSAASAAASAAVSALPTDICSSLSEQLSEFTSWFAMILGFIYLEKYLLTLLGGAACYFLIPVGCGALLINCFFPKNSLWNLGSKLLALAMVALFAIPTSIWVSDRINATYSQSIEITVESAGAVSDNLMGNMVNDSEENTTVIDEAKAILDDVSNSVAGVIDQFKNVLNRFIEAAAVMIVTTCLIPILVILFFLWTVKVLFNAPIVVPTQHPKPRKIKGSGSENSLMPREASGIPD